MTFTASDISMWRFVVPAVGNAALPITMNKWFCWIRLCREQWIYNTHNIVWYRTIPNIPYQIYHTIPYHTTHHISHIIYHISYIISQYHTIIPYHSITPHHSISNYTNHTSHHTIPYQIYHTILYHTILYYTVPYHISHTILCHHNTTSVITPYHSITSHQITPNHNIHHTTQQHAIPYTIVYTVLPYHSIP